MNLTISITNNSKFILLFLLIFILLFFLSCKQTTEPKLEVEMKLELEDVSCTEAWIKLTTNNLQLPATINLIKNNTVAQSFSLSSKDSLLYIDSLLPNQAYKLQVSHIVAGSIQNPVSSNELTVTTMDTTSHNFTWQSWEFGECGSSSLYDVEIIDENNIWAVGEIYIRDSLGNCDPNAYNAVHWDGTKWEFKRIEFYTFCPEGTGSGFYPARSIFKIDNENIVVSSGSQLAYLRNEIQIKRECIPVSVNKLWGSSSSDLYAVGNNGNIAHWDGVKWMKIESGTDLNFRDIYGSTDTKSGETEILTVCSKSNMSVNKIYKIKNNAIEEISNNGINWLLAGLWFIPKKYYYVVGDGIYGKKFLSDTIWKNIGINITNNVTPKVRGNDINDVFIVGAYGECLHFNGISWKSFIDHTAPSSPGGYVSVAVKNKTIAAVGSTSRQAIILLGKRIN